MNKKKILFGLIGTFVFLNLVVAGVFIINNFSFTFDVEEPLSFEYIWNEDSDVTCTNLVNETFASFSGLANPGRTIYPGNNERICFKITSLSNGDIPLYVNFSTNEFVESYTLNFPSEVSEGTSFGSLDFTISPSAEGTFTGSMSFGRGN